LVSAVGLKAMKVIVHYFKDKQLAESAEVGVDTTSEEVEVIE
jgi:hypothetical protein